MFGQLAGTQVTPEAYRRHAPLPLHAPSVPHIATPESVHWFNGSWPAGTEVHVPTEPVRAHDAHVPAQAVVQHTPCAQKFELHWLSAAHVAPTGSLPQLILTQLLGATQSAAAVVQLVLQAVALAH